MSPQASGFTTVWPCGTTRPNASTLNYTANHTAASATLVTLGTTCNYNNTTNLLLDATG